MNRRGQIEGLSSVLLVAVVTIPLTIGGGIYLNAALDSNASERVQLDIESSETFQDTNDCDNCSINLTHSGGDAVDPSAVRVIFEYGDTRKSKTLAAFDSTPADFDSFSRGDSVADWGSSFDASFEDLSEVEITLVRDERTLFTTVVTQQEGSRTTGDQADINRLGLDVPTVEYLGYNDTSEQIVWRASDSFPDGESLDIGTVTLINDTGQETFEWDSDDTTDAGYPNVSENNTASYTGITTASANRLPGAITFATEKNSMGSGNKRLYWGQYDDSSGFEDNDVQVDPVAVGPGVMSLRDDDTVRVPFVESGECSDGIQLVADLESQSGNPGSCIPGTADVRTPTYLGVGEWISSGSGIFYVTTTGDLQKASYTGSAWTTTDLTNPDDTPQAIVAVADVAGDSTDELLYVTTAGELRYRQQDGTEGTIGPVGIDVGGIGVGAPRSFDGQTAIPFVTNGGEVAVYYDDGGWRRTTFSGTDATETPLAAVNYDDDAETEIVYATSDEYRVLQDIGDVTTDTATVESVEFSANGNEEPIDGVGVSGYGIATSSGDPCSDVTLTLDVVDTDGNRVTDESTAC